MRKADIGRPKESVNNYLTSVVMNAKDLIQLTSGIEKKEWMILTLQQETRTVLDLLESNCAACFHAGAMSNIELNCFSVFQLIVKLS